MTEASDELRLVESIGSGLHTAHGDHSHVHSQKFFFLEGDPQGGRVTVVSMEGVLGQCHSQTLVLVVIMAVVSRYGGC